ncbi:MAG: Ig-like domain-containing protein, partial [Gammaproteobacteria bacterium]|nr:Ig-like domain-containing protein [Gammaproteobacteria bacterium]
YPDKMVVVTPSPAFGAGLVGTESQDFGDIFAEMLYYKTAPICLIPENRPFSVTVCEPDEDGETPAECTTLPDIPYNLLKEPEADFSKLYVGEKGKSGPVTAWDTWPADGAENVPSDIVISVEFDTPPINATEGVTLVMTECEGFSSGTLTAVPEAADGEGRKYVIRPERPLMYNAVYEIRAVGIEGFITGETTETEEPFTETVTFKTVKVKQTDSVAVENPYDVRVLSNCRLAVANGSATSDFENDGHGIVLIDISDRDNLKELSEKKIIGSTLGTDGVFSAESGQTDQLAAVSGGLENFGVLSIFDISGKKKSLLTLSGSTTLAMDSLSLHNGLCYANVPCTAGIPRRISVYEEGGEHFAYTATTGIGIQAVSLAQTAADLNQPYNTELPGLFGFGSFSDIPSPVAVEAVKYTVGEGDEAVTEKFVLAGDMKRLVLLDYELPDTELSFLDIPARDIRAVTGYMVEKPDVTEMMNLVFAVCQDQTFRIIDVTDIEDPDEIGKIDFDFTEPGEHLSSVRVDPEKRLAFVSSSESVYIVDIEHPDEGTAPIDNDGNETDDRILGKFSELEGAGSLDLGSAGTVYVGDPANGRVRAYAMPGYSAPPEVCPLEGIKLRDGKTTVSPGTTEVAEIMFAEGGTSEGEGDPKVVWSVSDRQNDNVLADIGSKNGIVSADENTPEHGYITIRATLDDPYRPCCYAERDIYIGCTLSTGSADVSANLSSVDVRFSLGRADLGKPAGNIVLRLDDPSAGLPASPRMLRFSALSDGAAAAYGEDGSLISAEAPEARADITTVNEYEYEISIYSKTDGSLTAKWQIINPGDNTDILEINETRGGRTKTYRYEHTGKAEAGTWNLIRSGTDSDGITTEITETRDETLTEDKRTVTQTVTQTGGDGKSFVTASVYRVYPPIIVTEESEDTEEPEEMVVPGYEELISVTEDT